MAGGSLIGALRVSLGLDSASFETGAKRAESRAYLLGERIGKTLRGAAGSVGTFQTALAALGGAAALGGLTAVANRALEYASSLGEVAQQLGVTTRDLQVYRYAATQVGVSQEEMDKGLAKLTVTMGKARAGAQEPVKVFRELSGLLGKDVLQGAKTAGDAIPLIAEALSKIPDPSKRAAIEVALFGKAGQKLDTLLAGGASGVNELADAAERAGVVLSDEQIQNADDTADKLAALKQVLEANIASAVTNNADAILTLADAFSQMVVNIGEAIEAYSNWKNIQGFRGGDTGATMALTRTKSGRATLFNEIDAQLQQNQRDRAGNRGKRTSYLGGLIETTREATPEDQAALDRQYQQLVRQRNALMKIDAAGGQARPRVRPGGAGAGAVDGETRASAAAASKAEKDRLRAAEEARRNDRAYQAELAQTQQEYLRSQADLTVDQVTRLAIERQQLDAEQLARDQQIASDEDLTAAQKEELTSINAKIAANRRELLTREAAEEAAKNNLDLRRADNDNQLDILQSQAALARTSRERRAVQLRILDLQFEMERATLEAVIASKQSTDTEKAIAQKRLDILGMLQGNARTGVERDTQGPLGELADSVPQTAAEMNEAFEGVAAGGLSDIIDGMADAATGARKMGDVVTDVLQDIATQLIKLQLQRSILEPIARALGGAFGGGDFSLPTTDYAGIQSMIGTTSLAPIDGARAKGGSVMAGKRYLVGEMGPELFEPGQMGRIVANDQMMTGGTTVHQTVNVTGAVDLATRTEVVRLASATKQATMQAMQDINRRRG
ncbi:MAG: hypothetical protein V4618_00865 [Pseudomonadota bacterium]